MSASHTMLLPNAAYAGKTPRILTASCHDRTPFVTIVCGGCGREMHIHESQIAAAPPDYQIGGRCTDCGHMVLFDAGQLQDAFTQMRNEGWIK